MFEGQADLTSDDSIDLIFGAKAGNPGAGDIAGGKKDKKGDDTPEDVVDPDDDDTQQGTGKTAKVQKTAADIAADKLAKKSTDEVADDLFGKDEEELDEDGNPKPKAKPARAALPKKDKPAETGKLEVGYEDLYKQLVADGVFDEIEGIPADAEWNADLFKEIQALQVKNRYDNFLDKTGPYGKAIIEYEKNGGQAGELINLFQEQRQVKDFDVSTPEGQEEFLTSYLEAQGYSTKSIDRTIKALIDQGAEALKEEADEKKTLWDKQYSEEIENSQKQQALVAKQMEDQAKTFNKTIKDTLTGDTEITPKDRSDLGNYILNYNQKFNGHDVSQFYVDMTEIQKDPASYVELAKFIKGLKSGDYKKKIETKAKKEVSAKTFLRVKNGSALSQRDGGSPELNEEEGSSFVSLLTSGRTK